MTQRGQSRIYTEPQRGSSNRQTTMVYASGAQVNVEAGASWQFDGQLNAASGRITLPGVLGRGFLNFDLGGGFAKTTATASGLVSPLATGVQPSLKTFETTDNRWQSRLRWTTAAGATNVFVLPPIRIPNDLSTAGGLKVHLNGERSSAQATDGGSGAVQVRVYANVASTTGNTNIGTTHELTSAPGESTADIASGSVPASGLLTVVLVPNGHSSTPIDLYGGGFSYQKKTS